MFVGELGNYMERKKAQACFWILGRQGIAAGTGSVIHRGCSEQEVTSSQLGKCPRAECQEEMSGFGNAEVGGKAPRVLTPQDEQRLRGDVM